MERFVCGAGSLHSQPDPDLLRTLKIETPQRLHFDQEGVLAAARGLERGGWTPLPFCNTLCSEGLGARPSLALEGARVKEPPYARTEELPREFSPDFPRMAAMLVAMDRLKSEGAQIAYSVEGPFTVLSALLPVNRMFAALRKPSGAELLSRAEDWVSRYARMAAEHGAKVLSYADPVATADILGEKTFTTVYLPCCRRLLRRLRQENPGVVVHLCGKMTQSLLDTESCRAVRWEPDPPCQTYGQALTAYCESGGKMIVGHFCLNMLAAKRLWLIQIEI